MQDEGSILKYAEGQSRRLPEDIQLFLSQDFLNWIIFDM